MGEISAGMDVTCGDDNLHANHSIFWIFGFYFLVLDGGQPKIDIVGDHRSCFSF